ncbi:Crp/Fnr family transcriptional regulator [Salipaludibacillus aurantiacus]|uniref:CRP/FNR family transcriptional regulator, anaerobic regulatory protein n=1 Tax=Salipaludibacillus aurantiacus TaxID=1601833 RepID=A0A1H9T803_9BACI|nr:Crp/Fnr family transcriptional regulator [Salipaludibacillus aurantiacus]SER93400.1 CRP/FNR family transcriptional regulator, anaerobic regulatory protein [Salipaludibacillus aurantiacus]
MSQEAKVQTLPTFYELVSKETKQLLYETGSEISVAKGSLLLREGELPDYIYFINKGQVRLTKTSSEGKVFFLQNKKQNDLIGELSLFNHLNCQFNAEVTQDAELLRFKRDELEKLMINKQELSVAYMQWLSSQNHIMMAQFRDLVFCGKQGAVFSILIKLSNEYGIEVKQGILINRKITNQELANYVGATRESINRILKRLIKQNILSVNTKYITIHNIDFLKNHLRCHNCPFEECTV